MSAIVYPSSEFVQLAGREVKLQYIEHDGERIADAAQRIKKNCTDAGEEAVIVRTWLRCEFNVPATIRAHCASCFIRVFYNEQFNAAVYVPRQEIQLGEQVYRLHWQSNPTVCCTAPLIAVSFRRTHEGECFAVAQVWAPKSLKSYQPRPTTTAKE